MRSPIHLSAYADVTVGPDLLEVRRRGTVVLVILVFQHNEIRQLIYDDTITFEQLKFAFFEDSLHYLRI